MYVINKVADFINIHCLVSEIQQIIYWHQKTQLSNMGKSRSSWLQFVLKVASLLAHTHVVEHTTDVLLGQWFSTLR